MTQRFHGQDRRIVAGLKTIHSDSPYLESLVGLSERTAMHLQLVHVTEAWSDEPYSGEVSVETNTAQEVNQLIKTPISFATTARVGDPLQWMTEETEVANSAMVVCGMERKVGRFTPTGFSTSLGLMGKSRIPVLVLPNHRVDFRKKDFKVLVADDLASDCDALNTAIEFANGLGEANIVHAHVAPKKDTADLAASREREDSFASKLLARAEEPLTQQKNPNLNYQHKVCYGDVFETLENLVIEESPDLIVFGKHQTLHTKPFRVGKMPFFAMTRFEVPLLVVPDQDS